MGVCNQAICGPQDMKKKRIRKKKKLNQNTKIDIPRYIHIYITYLHRYNKIVPT